MQSIKIKTQHARPNLKAHIVVRLVTDLLAGGVLGVGWYLTFDIVWNFSNSVPIHPGNYLIGWGLALFAWELVSTGHSNNAESRWIPVGWWGTYFLKLLLAFALTLPALYQINKSGWTQHDPNATAMLALQALLGLYFLGPRSWLSAESKPLYNLCAAILLLLCSLAVTEGLFRVAGWTVRSLTEQTGDGDIKHSQLPTYRILCVGDSHTRGVGAPADKSYPRQLQQLLQTQHRQANFRVFNTGIPGSNSSDTRLEFERWWNQNSYDAVLVWCGVNNLWSLKNVPTELLQNEQVSRWTRLGWWLSDKLGGVRLVRLARLIWINLLHNSEPEQTRQEMNTRQRNIELRRNLQTALRKIRSYDHHPLEAIPEYTPEQVKAFYCLALPEIMPPARIEPLAEWIDDSTTELWTTQDWILHGWAHLRLKKKAVLKARMPAIQSFLKAIESEPYAYWAWVGLARSVLDVLPEQALPVIREMDMCMPDDPIISGLLLQITEKRDPRYWAEHIQESINNDPEQWPVPAYYLENALQDGQMKNILNRLNETSMRWGDSPWWAFALAKAMLHADREQDAKHWFVEFVNRSTPNEADAWSQIGNYLLTQKKYLLANEILNPTTAWKLQDTRVDRCIVEARTGLHRYEDAIDYGLKAIERNDQDADLIYSLAWAYDRKWVQTTAVEDWRNALDYYEKAFQRGYRFRDIYTRLYSIMPKSQLYPLVNYYERTYGVQFSLHGQVEETVDRQTRQRILIHDLEHIHHQVQQRNALMMIFTYPSNRAGKRSEFDAVYRSFSEKNEVPLVDVTRLLEEKVRFAKREEYFAPDGHPNAKGYTVVAEEVFRMLENNPQFLSWVNRLPKKTESTTRERI